MRNIVIAFAASLIGAALVIGDADAARLGGGRSLGAQRSVTRTPPASTPAKPAQQAAPQQQPAPAQAAPQPQPQGGFLSRWGPLLGGLALGGLLGSLFGGSGLGGILLLVLGALAVFMVVGALARRRGSASEPVQLAGLNERTTLPGAQPAPAGTAAPAATPRVPAGFDTATFLRGAKMNFVKLQLANDSGDLDQIREFTTSEMFDALAGELRGRAGAQQTDITSLDAELLDVASEADRHWASVRFSGASREAPGAPAENFEEVWNLVKPADGSSGWLLAGIQQVH
jgi:predicted lipid-binding transport protein (Tim44 family)